MDPGCLLRETLWTCPTGKTQDTLDKCLSASCDSIRVLPEELFLTTKGFGDILENKRSLSLDLWSILCVVVNSQTKMVCYKDFLFASRVLIYMSSTVILHILLRFYVNIKCYTLEIRNLQQVNDVQSLSWWKHGSMFVWINKPFNCLKQLLYSCVLGVSHLLKQTNVAASDDLKHKTWWWGEDLSLLSGIFTCSCSCSYLWGCNENVLDLKPIFNIRKPLLSYSIIYIINSIRIVTQKEPPSWWLLYKENILKKSQKYSIKIKLQV